MLYCRYDPASLVTVGSWSEKTQYTPSPLHPEPSTFNYFSDTCLTLAGGYLDGILDFFQMHTYSYMSNPYNAYSPMKVCGHASEFNVT